MWAPTLVPYFGTLIGVPYLGTPLMVRPLWCNASSWGLPQKKSISEHKRDLIHIQPHILSKRLLLQQKGNTSEVGYQDQQTFTQRFRFAICAVPNSRVAARLFLLRNLHLQVVDG